MPFGAPRKVLPVWAIALIVVLAVAVLALGGAWLRSEWSAGARQARVDALAPRPRLHCPGARRAPAWRGRSAARRSAPRQLTERSLARDSGRSIPPATQSSLRGAPDARRPRRSPHPPSADRTEEPRSARRRARRPSRPARAVPSCRARPLSRPKASRYRSSRYSSSRSTTRRPTATCSSTARRYKRRRDARGGTQSRLDHDERRGAVLSRPRVHAHAVARSELDVRGTRSSAQSPARRHCAGRSLRCRPATSRARDCERRDR